MGCFHAALKRYSRIMTPHSSMKQNVVFSEYEPLVVALFVRDVMHLSIDRSVPIPRLSPAPVQDYVAPSAGVSGLERQWLQWWKEIVRLADASFRDSNAPIDYVAPLNALPELKEYAEKVLDDARGWRAGKVDASASWRNALSPDFLPPLAMRMVKMLLRREDREAFRNVAFAVVPVDEKSGWSLSPGLYVVSADLVSDREAFENWFASELLGKQKPGG